MSFSNIFKISYFFDNFSGITFPGFWGVLIILIFILLVSAIVSYKAGKWPAFKRQVAVRFTRAGFIIGWFGLAWMFFRFEGIPYLCWRLWPALLFIYLIIEMVYLVKYAKFDYPKRKAAKIGGKDKDLYLRRFLGK